MPSSPSANLGLEKQATGENPLTWGVRLNSVIDLVEEALTGRVAVGGNITLTNTNYVSNQARCVFLDCSAAATITVPAIKKFWFVRAGSGDVTVTTGGPTAATVKSGNTELVISDGAAVYAARTVDFGATIPLSSTNPTVASHLTRKAYVDALHIVALAAADTAEADAKAYADGLVFTAAGGNLPAQAANPGRFLTTNGTTLSWGEPDAWTAVSSDITLAVRGSYHVDTTAARLLTLPISPADGTVIAVADSTGGASLFNITVDGDGAQTINGDATLVIDDDYGAVLLIAVTGGWRIVRLA